ncbi:MAG: hypothetical protein JNM18_26515, partial [Planctomycetaceae bacterium]|nr:hypothetical protein [Planctomycetaceae bacterium]
MTPESIRGALQQLMAKQLGSAMDIGPANTPAAQAQDLVYQAREARTVAQQMKLIKRALQLDPDCVDALVLLGDQAPSPQAAIDQYRVAIAAGERVLANNFADMVGDMWMFLEARGYLRARQSLADALTVTGHLAEAVEEYREILRLNKNDNQGVRERLLALYFELGRNDDALRLLRTYPEDSAAFSYGEVLLSFRIHGDSPETDRLLKAARKVNKHVPAYLLHDKPLPSRIPETYGFGDVNEAVIYAATYLPAWKSSPGAITWLRGAVAPAKKSKSKKTTLTIKVPEATPEQFLAIEQDPATIWQLDLRQVPTWVENEAGQAVRPWLIMVVREFDAVVVGQEMSLDRPDEDALWRCLTKAILKPFTQEQPARPGIVQFCRNGLHTQFLPKLAVLGIACEIHDDLRALDHMLQVLAEATSSDDDRP